VRESKRSSHSLLFREVNDRVFELLSEMGSEDGEFLCECSDTSCVETIHLTMREYAALQAQPDRPPLTLSGHPD
jgi:hypothetical protein